ncbi:MAG TPA: 3'-5' exonuclease [Myxococcales bacterium]|nr:3'-5' exonuclease [Myxococcales bacterium]HIN86809.1 3'-5' exonuclease [Myxococcales bacterium]
MTYENWFDAELAVVDVETTGLDASSERIIEIGIIHMKAGEILDSWGQLIDPKRPIPEEVTKLTGISQSDVEGKPFFDQIAAEVRSRMEGRVCVAYNLSFDRGFITAELERVGTTWPEGPALDPLVFAREIQRSAGSKRLTSVAERLGIELLEAHRAVDDAIIAGKVLYAFREQLPERLEDLIQLQQQWAQQQEQQMATWRRRRRSNDEDSENSEKPKSEPVSTTAASDEKIALGPAYVYGDEPDPLRFLFKQLPDAGSRR